MSTQTNFWDKMMKQIYIYGLCTTLLKDLIRTHSEWNNITYQSLPSIRAYISFWAFPTLHFSLRWILTWDTTSLQTILWIAPIAIWTCTASISGFSTDVTIWTSLWRKLGMISSCEYKPWGGAPKLAHARSFKAMVWRTHSFVLNLPAAGRFHRTFLTIWLNYISLVVNHLW